MIYGYARVSSAGQAIDGNSLEAQSELLKANGAQKIFSDVYTGTKLHRPELDKLMAEIQPGDTLIVTEVSRLSRTLTDIMSIMGKCLEKGINLYTTKEGYSFDNTINSKVLCFAFGLVAEIEHNLISLRTKEALALRKAEGTVLGRKKGSYTKTNVLIENRRIIIGMLKRDCSVADICRRFDISRDAYAKFRKQYKDVMKALNEKEERRRVRALYRQGF